MAGHMGSFAQILAITGPVFGMMIAGFTLRNLQVINDAFIGTASNLTYRVTMPLLLFIGISTTDLGTALQPGLILYFSMATLVGFFAAWLWAIKRVPRDDRGVYVQGAIRGNCGILGLALATSLYGDYGLSVGGVLAGLVIILFNVLSTIILTIYSPSFKISTRAIIRELAQNPLIISVLVALLASHARIELPFWLLQPAESLAAITLPLALLCIGGSLSIRAMLESGQLAISASLFKLVIIPVVFTGLAVIIGFEGRELGVLFLFLACPTAAISYVMVCAAGSNAELAANIIALSTVLSLGTLILGLYSLQLLGWI